MRQMQAKYRSALSGSFADWMLGGLDALRMGCFADGMFSLCGMDALRIGCFADGMLFADWMLFG